MPVRSIKPIRPFVWIPPATSTVYKWTVERDNGTVDDITSLLVALRVEDYVTDSIGNFEFEVLNGNNEFTNRWNGNEIVRYYKDYGTTASTLVFRGRIEKPSAKGYRMNVKGRSESLKFMDDVKVTAEYEGAECSTILKDIISRFASGFTDTGVEVSSVNLTISWFQTPFWKCVQDLCNAAGFECYVDPNLAFQYFLSGSRKNSTDAIVHTQNMLELEDFAPDVSLVKNKIKVYGAIEDGIQTVYTAKDDTSISAYGERVEVISDDTITNFNQAKDIAEFNLAQKKDPPIVGAIKGILLATPKPGEQVPLSSPDDGITPGYYFTTGYVDTLPLGGSAPLSTKLVLTKEPRRMSHVVRDRIEQENKKKQANLNPDDLDRSYNFLYDDATVGTFSNTEAVNSFLKTKGAGSPKTWTSPTRTLDSDVSEVYLLLVGQTLDGALVEVSGDNGVNFQTVTNKTKTTITTAKGSHLIVRVTLSDTATQIDSLSLLYSEE